MGSCKSSIMQERGETEVLEAELERQDWFEDVFCTDCLRD